MRGGITYTAKRFSKANNKYMQSYDDKKPRKYIKYLSETNLYSWEMSQYFPCGKFKCLNEKEIGKLEVNLIGENNFDR